MATGRLALEEQMHRRLREHLLGEETEHAAFLFADWEQTADRVELHGRDCWLLHPAAFAHQSAFHLELADRVLPEAIKRAHDAKRALVEFHSHLSDRPARFSWTDIRGLQEVVPHVRWRLADRPYAAFVVSPSSFDSLCWPGPLEAPVSVAWHVGGKALTATQLSISAWKEAFHDERE